ncbi:hypothetical protein EJ08DRAFT_698718 [Tothia fuscella]|uniref:Uncharacterized protein n=1 Tax=Tothia fuscella TaxID=1048955 RepID=A0A9P4NP45_9PEZI|nr:hypothetical protein EJ08DRAFT_698718 [Tothia fuscella]
MAPKRGNTNPRKTAPKKAAAPPPPSSSTEEEADISDFPYGDMEELTIPPAQQETAPAMSQLGSQDLAFSTPRSKRARSEDEEVEEVTSPPSVEQIRMAANAIIHRTTNRRPDGKRLWRGGLLTGPVLGSRVEKRETCSQTGSRSTSESPTDAGSKGKKAKKVKGKKEPPEQPSKGPSAFDKRRKRDDDPPAGAGMAV